MYRVLDESHEGIVGIKIEGKFTPEDYQGLLPYLKRLREEVCPLNLLFEVQNPEVQRNNGSWSDLAAHLQDISGIHRMAVIGGDNYLQLQWQSEKVSSVSKNEIKYFSSEQLDEAWSWLKGE